jgi:hypothetical protein
MGTSYGNGDCLELRVTVGKTANRGRPPPPRARPGRGGADREAASPPSPPPGAGVCVRAALEAPS